MPHLLADEVYRSLSGESLHLGAGSLLAEHLIEVQAELGHEQPLEARQPLVQVVYWGLTRPTKAQLLALLTHMMIIRVRHENI
jgi:hypothetical protein